MAFFQPGDLVLWISWTGEVLFNKPPGLILSMSIGEECVSGSVRPCNLYSIWWTNFLIDEVNPEWLEKMIPDSENP